MSRNFLKFAMVSAGAMMWASAAQADLITVGLQDPLVNGGLITTVASSNTGTMNWTSTPYGTFTTNGSSNDTLTLGLPAILYSNTIDVSAGGAGTLTVYVVASDQTSLSGFTHWVSTFTSNDLDNVDPVQETTYFDQGNGIFNAGNTSVSSTAQLLQTATVFGAVAPFNSASGSNNQPGVTTPWSVMEVYTITASAANEHFNDTIDINANIPEPASLALLGGGLVAFGAWRRRRSQKA